jgi:cellulose synthase/poly-beta-1,6-N-acetylglucosamine synthase-like glycosyltransferase
VRVFRKANGGKWSAHNFAFQHARGELVLCLDADSQLEPTALRRLAARMADPRLDGVSGQIRVRNRDRLLTRLQGLEYVMANGALRTAQGLTGSVLIVPGPIGMFRRSGMEAVYLRYGDLPDPAAGEVPGPFEGDTFAEDFDLSLAVLSLGGRIDYEPSAVSRTQAPDTPMALINQRYRWCRGMMQVLRKYLRRAWSDPSLASGRVLAWIGVTYLLDLLVLPMVYLVVLTGTLAYLAAGGPGGSLLAWMGAFVALNLNAAAMFVAMHNDRLTLLRVLPFYDLYQGLMLNAAWGISVIDELRNTRMRWS